MQLNGYTEWLKIGAIALALASALTSVVLFLGDIKNSIEDLEKQIEKQESIHRQDVRDFQSDSLLIKSQLNSQANKIKYLENKGFRDEWEDE